MKKEEKRLLVKQATELTRLGLSVEKAANASRHWLNRKCRSTIQACCQLWKCLKNWIQSGNGWSKNI